MGHFTSTRAKKDGNHKEIVKALRTTGAKVWVIDLPCDLIVKYQDVIYLIDVKAIDGKPTDLQYKFNRAMDDTIHFVRSIDEAMFAIGAAYPPYDYKAEVCDQTVLVTFYHANEVLGRPISRVLEGLQSVQGVRNISGLDDSDELMVWPRKGIKVEALLKRIDQFLDYQRIGVSIS